MSQSKPIRPESVAKKMVVSMMVVNRSGRACFMQVVMRQMSELAIGKSYGSASHAYD
jgi:hypothetical protein